MVFPKFSALGTRLEMPLRRMSDHEGIKCSVSFFFFLTFGIFHVMCSVLYIIGNVELGRQIGAGSDLDIVHVDSTIKAIKVDKIA